jgi:hypothetical protein
MCLVASWNTVLIHKTNYARPACFNVTRFILLASLRDLARVVIPSDGDDFAKTPALCLQTFFYKSLHSTLRNLPFYRVILDIFSEFLKLRSGQVLEYVIKGRRWGWRRGGRSRFTWRKYAMFA